jgi:hypothetical protein
LPVEDRWFKSVTFPVAESIEKALTPAPTVTRETMSNDEPQKPAC